MALGWLDHGLVVHTPDEMDHQIGDLLRILPVGSVAALVDKMELCLIDRHADQPEKVHSHVVGRRTIIVSPDDIGGCFQAACLQHLQCLILGLVQPPTGA
jgi:hypothetical protein